MFNARDIVNEEQQNRWYLLDLGIYRGSRMDSEEILDLRQSANFGTIGGFKRRRENNFDRDYGHVQYNFVPPEARHQSYLCNPLNVSPETRNQHYMPLSANNSVMPGGYMNYNNIETLQPEPPAAPLGLSRKNQNDLLPPATQQRNFRHDTFHIYEGTPTMRNERYMSPDILASNTNMVYNNIEEPKQENHAPRAYDLTTRHRNVCVDRLNNYEVPPNQHYGSPNISTALPCNSCETPAKRYRFEQDADLSFEIPTSLECPLDLRTSKPCSVLFSPRNSSTPYSLSNSDYSETESDVEEKYSGGVQPLEVPHEVPPRLEPPPVTPTIFSNEIDYHIAAKKIELMIGSFFRRM